MNIRVRQDSVLEVSSNQLRVQPAEPSNCQDQYTYAAGPNVQNAHSRPLTPVHEPNSTRMERGRGLWKEKEGWGPTGYGFVILPQPTSERVLLGVPLQQGGTDCFPLGLPFQRGSPAT
eukprot:CAMPEP_0114521026 /NCGR_PEP_ID=MMETSP0109-20121206/19953_1 /TAXON_ID=29199 /ORGANISM="Chlorarachnion reptans, Strain CCCM449" /LENGTH=117 /DNA_ID=CAMNT_0001702077 /DNA_START=145 /DNA_END=494 /DNA_ORIENTATION=+